MTEVTYKKGRIKQASNLWALCGVVINRKVMSHELIAKEDRSRRNEG